MPLTQNLYDLLQSQANIQDTRAQTEQRQLSAMALKQQMQEQDMKMKERDATKQVLMQTLAGGPAAQVDKSLDPAETDTTIIAAKKEIQRLRIESQQSSKMAQEILKAGGSMEAAEQYRKDAINATSRAGLAQSRLLNEQKTVAQEIGGIAGTANSDDKAGNFELAANRIKELDPDLYKRLPFDKDVMGNPVWGNTSKQTMDSLFNSSMTSAQQLDRQIKLTDQQRKDREEQLRAEDQKRKDRLTDAQIAKQLSGVAKDEAQTAKYKEQTGEQKAKAQRLDQMAAKPATPALKESAKQVAKTAFPDEKFDSSLDAFAADVADRANRIRSEAFRAGDEIGLDEARQQAIDELKPFVTRKVEKRWFGADIVTRSYSQAGKPTTGEKAAPASSVQDGTVIVNKATGERKVMKDGQWQTVQ